MENIQNYALITGGSTGIGLEIAKLFAADGINLIIVARKQDELDQAANILQKEGIEVSTIVKDLSIPESANELYEEIKEKNIEVNTLVNNAGQGVYGEFLDTDPNRELAIIQLNIISLVTLTKLFAKDMVAKKNGKILNLASIASKAPGPYQSVYHGTKAFVHSFTEAIRYELKDSGVTVTSLLPGATDTDFFNKADMLDAKIVQEGELADPADVAKDGYEAMKAGQDMVVSGFKNKVQVAMGNVTPDRIQAAQLANMQEPVHEEKK